LLDAADAIGHYESATAHGYQEDKQQILFEAVERWLKPPRPRGREVLAAPLESLEELRCGLPEGNLTCRDVFAQWAAGLPRFDGLASPEANRSRLREQLGWPAPLPEVAAQELARDRAGEWSATYWAIETEGRVRLPLMHLHRRKRSGKFVLLPGGSHDDVLSALEDAGEVVVVAPRGTGEMTMPKSLRNWAWFAGRPLAGMHALDLAQAAMFCRRRLGAKSVAMVARNDFGFTALLAGAAMPDLLDSGDVVVPVDSFRALLEEQGDVALAEVPGLFEYFDIPQLTAMWPGGRVATQHAE
jgi:hypothetical protein